MAIAAVRLERERRKSRRESAMLDILSRREVCAPLVGVGGLIALQQLGKSRALPRDFAGGLSSLWATMILASLGVTDRWALGAAATAAAAGYAIAVPPAEDEAVVVLDPSSPLGGDGKLFGLPMGGLLGQ